MMQHTENLQKVRRQLYWKIMNKKTPDMPIYRQIEEAVKSYIVDHQLPRHALLPSESELSKEFGACINTVRKALNNLVTEKVIYRRHGQGTFVSPRIRKQKLLVVTSLRSPGRNTEEDCFRFYAGAQAEANSRDLPYEPMMVDLDDFMANLHDVTMVYPEVAGVIFFRGIGNWQQSHRELTEQKIPMMFVGPDLERERGVTCSRMFYREESIARLCLEYIQRKNIRKVAVLAEQSGIGRSRASWFRQLAPESLMVWECPEDVHQSPDGMRDLACRADLVYCTMDRLAIKLIQAMELDAGLRIPEDVAVMGVDDIVSSQLLRPTLSSVSLCNYENGARAMRRFSEFLQNNEQEPFELDAELRLMPRESC